MVGATGFEPATPCAQGKLGVAFEVLFSEQFTASENCSGRFCGRVPGERRTIVGMWSDSVFARRRTSCEDGVEGGWIEAMKYLIVIERTGTGFSAYSPDLPGCIATGNTRDEVEREMNGAIALHLDGLKAEGMAIPQPSSSSSYVEIPA